MFNFDAIVKSLQTDPNAQKVAGAGAAGLAAGLIFGGGGFGRIAKMGALAAVGGLAYNAWKQHEARKAATSGAPDEAAFIPRDPAIREELGKTMVRAMIAAAKADGRVDADEKEAIFRRLETMPLSADEKAFVFDELAGPLDLDRIVASADTPEHAAEIYTASLVAMRPDTPAETAYLEVLASRLGLDPALVAEIHAAAALES